MSRPRTITGYVEFEHMGTEYVADYEYDQNGYDITRISFDDGSQEGRAADEHSPFYPALVRLANDVLLQEFERRAERAEERKFESYHSGGSGFNDAEEARQQWVRDNLKR